MVQNPWLVFLQFSAFLTNCFSQSAHKFKVVFVIDRRPCGKNSWWTMPLQSKKTVSKTFTFDRTWCAFFDLCSSGGFHWDDWGLVDDSSSVMNLLNMSGSSLNVVKISWAILVLLKSEQFENNFSARIHWKADAPKTSPCLVWILFQRHTWAIFFENEQGDVVTVNGHRYRAMLNEVLFTKIEEEDIGTFCFNRTALSATQPKQHSMFCGLILKIALSAAELILFGHVGAVIWHRWTINCGMPSKISVTATSQRKLTL